MLGTCILPSHGFCFENQKTIEAWHLSLLERQKDELGLKLTSNERFLIDDEGVYYQLENQIYEKVPEVIVVNNDGSYVLKTPIRNKSAYFQITNYNIKDVPTSLSVVDIHDKPIKSLGLIVKLLSLRKEYVKKFKCSGTSGNSCDLIANFLNFFVKPLESGCYMDEKYNFYTWDGLSHCLKIDLRAGLKPGSALLSQYEFIDEKTVVRTDFDGKGLQPGNVLQFAN